MLDLVFGDYTTRGDHGVNMDIWSAGGGGGGIVTPDLHLHHHDGLPKTFHIFSIWGFLYRMSCSNTLFSDLNTASFRLIVIRNREKLK